jgi:putative peptidoglycan lipid II flippase
MRLHLRSLFDQKRILGGTIVVAIGQFGASLAGLVRDRLLASTFPKLGVVDVYYASFRPSDLLFQIFIMAGFSVALVPLLAKYHASDDNGEMSRLMNGIVAVAVIFFGILALVLGILFPWVAPFFVRFQGEQLDLYIQFGRIALLTNFLFVFGNAYGQYLITVQRYWIYGLTPVLYTLGTILGTVFLTPYYGAYGPMIGTLAGGVVYVLGRLIAILWIGYRPALSFWHPDVAKLGILMLPRMIALGILQLELLVFDGVASGLPAGSVTINAFTRNFQSFVMGLSGMALGLAIFSMLSQAAAKGEWSRFKTYLRKGTLFVLALTIPGAIGIVLLIPVEVWLMHVKQATAVFTTCIVIYAVSIPFEGLNHLYTRAFFAVKHTTIPAVLNVVNGAVAIVIAWFLAPRIGIAALPLGYAIGQALEVFGLVAFLPGETRILRSEF